MHDEKQTTRPPDSILEYQEKHYPGRLITAEDYISMSGIPAEDYGGERLAEVPRKFRRKIEIMARQARKEAETRGISHENIDETDEGWVN
jgi:hypothetical protein